jgi:short chain dehydrogenase
MPNAVVTGAASGMGLATARLLSSEGWSVLALDRTDTTVTTGAGPIRTVPVDVTRRSEVAAAIGKHLDHRGGIDLVANVGAAHGRRLRDRQRWSVDAFGVSPGQLLYGAAAAVVMLTKALARVLQLAGPHAGFVTGESVVLSGGDVLR